MTLYTSYFSFVKDVPPQYLVSVAGRAPNGFNGAEYRKLAPKYSWWRQWHDENLGFEWYTARYYETVLNKLDAESVAREIGENKILLCWEGPEQFCHRHLIADWMRKSAGISVIELSKINKQGFIR